MNIDLSIIIPALNEEKNISKAINNCLSALNSLKINGATADLVVDVEDAAIQLVYTGATYGWKLTSNN